MCLLKATKQHKMSLKDTFAVLHGFVVVLATYVIFIYINHYTE